MQESIVVIRFICDGKEIIGTWEFTWTDHFLNTPSLSLMIFYAASDMLQFILAFSILCLSTKFSWNMSNGCPLNFVVNVFPVRTHKKGEDHFDTRNAYFILAQFLAILQLRKKGVIQIIRRGPDMGCLCLHIKKGDDHFYTLNTHFIFAKLRTVLHLS